MKLIRHIRIRDVLIALFLGVSIPLLFAHIITPVLSALGLMVYPYEPTLVHFLIEGASMFFLSLWIIVDDRISRIKANDFIKGVF